MSWWLSSWLSVEGALLVWPIIWGQSKRSTASSPRRPSMNSRDVDSCLSLWKQTIDCLISDLSSLWCLRWCHSFPSWTLLFVNLSSRRLTLETEVMEGRSEEVERRRLKEFSKSAQASPIGLTSSFFPFPSLPPLSLCLSLFILFLFHCYPSLVSLPCSTARLHSW